MTIRVPRKETVVLAATIALAILGILATVFGLKPNEWPEKLSAWDGFFAVALDETLANKWKVSVAVLLGLFIGYFGRRPRPPNILTAPQFIQKFQELFAVEDIRTLLIFGYTHETVRDYQKYDHLYQEGLDIRILNRCWIAEEKDEGLHNKKIEGLNLRPWKKSETIHQAELAPWTYKANRQIRYYDFTHPVIKGVILKSKRSKWAFVNFYKWEEIPHDGGSQFKGADLGMIFLNASNLHERSKLEALESQFELVWKYRSHSPGQHHGSYLSYFPPPHENSQSPAMAT